VNGFIGIACEVPTFDPCQGITCQNGGTCGAGVCACVNGFTGPACETNIDDCAPNA